MKYLFCTNLIAFLYRKQVNVILSVRILRCQTLIPGGSSITNISEQTQAEFFSVSRNSTRPSEYFIQNQHCPALKIRAALYEDGLALFKEEHVPGTLIRNRDTAGGYTCREWLQMELESRWILSRSLGRVLLWLSPISGITKFERLLTYGSVRT